MKQYLDLLQDVLDNGTFTTDRTGVNTISKFGAQLRFNLDDGFPLLTTKKLHFKSIVGELLWLISGTKSKQFLIDNNIKIWDSWSMKDDINSVGEMYGHLWRHFPSRDSADGIDQLQNVIDRLETNPDCRRLIVNAWSPDSMAHNDTEARQALACCHNMYQFKSYELTLQERHDIALKCGYYTNNYDTHERMDSIFVPRRKLSIMVNIRSNDLFLGNPYNTASYAILLMMVAQLTRQHASEVILNIGDAHIYTNHIEQVKEQLTRKPTKLPTVELNDLIYNINDFKFEDIVLSDYVAQPSIKGDVAV